jgi:hypothetical protein
MTRYVLYAALCLGCLGRTERGEAARVSASSAEGAHPASRAFDGRRDTRWSSDFSDPQWIEIDFDEPQELVGLKILWELAHASDYDIQISDGGTNWQTIYWVEQGNGGEDDLDFGPVKASALRIAGRRRGTAWGYSIYEIILRRRRRPGAKMNRPMYCIGAIGRSMETSHRNAAVHFLSRRHGAMTIRFYSWRKTLRWRSMAGRRGGVGAPRLSAGMSRIPIKGARTVRRLQPVFRCDDRRGQAALTGGTQAWTRAIQAYRARGREAYFGFLSGIQPDGYYPYWMAGRQGYWTVVGTERDDRESLLCEDGALEPYKSFSVTPFFYVDGRLLTRDDLRSSPFSTRWERRCRWFDGKGGRWGWMSGPLPPARPDAAQRIFVIAFATTQTNRLDGRLLLTLRPFEVNPPWQWGGYNRLHNISREGHAVRANEFSLILLSPPDAFGATEPRLSDFMTGLSRGELPMPRRFTIRTAWPPACWPMTSA